MKRYFILSCLMALFTLTVFAQSNMTDEQIMQYIVKEHASGTSNQQIGIQLMQRGVDIQQIRRVRSKYEREMKNQGLGNISSNPQNIEDRSRQANGTLKTVQDKLTARDVKTIRMLRLISHNTVLRTSISNLVLLFMTIQMPTGF